VVETEPQLTLRFYDGQNPALMEKALDTIGSGVVYPMLFNDDVNIPAVASGFRAREDDAMQYMPYGCGEYGLEHLCIGSPNGAFSVYSLLEAMIFNGRSTKGGAAPIPVEKRFEDYRTFDEFYGDFAGYMRKYAEPQVRRQRLEHDVEAEELGFLYCSALTDDCIARGLPLTGGGARYRGGVVETFGLVNAADSMAAIKKFVFEDKVFSPEKLREMLAADFEGYEAERRALADFSKFGNDDDYADAILARMSDDMCGAYNMHAPGAGLDYYLACNVNNRANVELGRNTPATPEGRRAGAPLANGNTPTAGNDRSGVTAFLSSAAKIRHDNNSGYTHNMKFSKSMFRDERPKVAFLLKTFFSMGGPSAMITCVGRDDLQNAKRDPENYKSLMVRVGGFSARFVELEPDVQDDIINRTMY
jgi:pyruvate-formate lyase